MDKYAKSYSRVLRYAAERGLPAEAGFHAKINAEPAEKTHQLVYADWLADNGKPHLAELIRRAVESEGGLKRNNLGREWQAPHVAETLSDGNWHAGWWRPRKGQGGSHYFYLSRQDESSRPSPDAAPTHNWQTYVAVPDAAEAKRLAEGMHAEGVGSLGEDVAESRADPEATWAPRKRR